MVAGALDFLGDSLTYGLSLVVIGNIAVIGAAGAVAVTQSAWPDLIVAALMAALFVSSARQIIRQALRERGHLAGGV
uniref:hypothetical protein n=1 Tax=Yoonia sp. TaxID=2212373 RepID=UPI00404790B3